MAVISRGGRTMIIRSLSSSPPSSPSFSFVSRILERRGGGEFSAEISQSDHDMQTPLTVTYMIWDGDGLHRLVFLDSLTGDEFKSEDELFTHYVQILAKAIGSEEEEAKRRIYLVSCGCMFGFCAEIDEELETQLRQDNKNVTGVFHDPLYIKRNKDPIVQSRVRFTPINLNHCFDSIFSYHYLSEPNKKWNTDHWLVCIDQPVRGFIHGAHVIDTYIDMLAKVVGSEEAAIKSIYSVWLKFPFGFGAKIDLKTKNKLIGCCPYLVTIIPDFAFDIKAKEGDGRNALHILPSLCGLRISWCRLEKEYGSEDWFISMEDHVGQSVHTRSNFLRFFPNLSDPYLTNKDTRSACKHWFIVMEKPSGETYSFQGRIDYCIQILSTWLGWNVRRKIYRIKCVSEYIGFGINIAKRTSDGLRDMHGVRGVLPDYSLRKSNEVDWLKSPNKQHHILGDMFTYFNLCGGRTLKDCGHWLIHIKEPNEGFRTEPQIINFCIQMLAHVVGSEDAKKKIYIVWCKTPYGFGAKIDMKTLKLLKGLPDVLAVLPDVRSDAIDRFRGVLVISPIRFRSPDRGSLFYRGLYHSLRESGDSSD